MKNIFLSLYCTMLVFAVSSAAIVDTVNIHSELMHKDFNCVVIVPSKEKNNPTYFLSSTCCMAIVAGMPTGLSGYRN